MHKPYVNSLAAWRGLHLCGRPGKLSIDAEMRAYVDELLTANTFRQVAAACLERFGPDRAPRKSAIYRYWQETRYRYWQETRSPAPFPSPKPTKNTRKAKMQPFKYPLKTVLRNFGYPHSCQGAIGACWPFWRARPDGRGKRV